MRALTSIVFLALLATPAFTSAETNYSFSARAEVLGAKPDSDKTTKASIDTLLAGSEPNLRNCYEKQSKKNPDLHYDVEFAIFLVLDEGAMSFYGLPEVRQREVWDWGLYNCVANEIKSWSPEKVSGEVELRFRFVADVAEGTPIHLVTAVGKPLTIQSGPGFDEGFANEFAGRLAARPNGENPWKACGDRSPSQVQGDVQLQIMVDEYGFVLPISPQWLGTDELDGQTLECLRATLEQLVGPTMPVTEDRSGYHLAVNVQFDHKPDRSGPAVHGGTPDADGAVSPVSPITTATNVCSTLVDAQSGKARRAELGKACARLPGCLSAGDATEDITLRELQRELRSLGMAARQCDEEQCQDRLRRFEDRCRAVIELDTAE